MREERVEGDGLGRTLRIALAFLLPAAVGGLVGSLILSFTLYSEVVSEPADEDQVFVITRTGMLFLGTMLGATWGQLATLIIGLPAHNWLMHNTRRLAWMYLIAGSAAGLIFGVLFFGPVFFGATFPPITGLAWIMLTGVVAGAAAALTFWLIRRPDKDVRLNHSGSNATSA